MDLIRNMTKAKPIFVATMCHLVAADFTFSADGADTSKNGAKKREFINVQKRASA